ncbi:MAG: polysaccharide deacetylase family protein [Candidatus Omnitrophica bacterium]|nr:polysaccharide deacetylase family protein [Candidatus Omnitrophota bacterium]
MTWTLPYRYPPILTYHRLDPVRRTDTPTLTPQAFERQMEWLAKGWKVISMADLASGLEGKRRLSGRSVVITFDDGTEDNHRYAFPVLKRLGLPALIFVITDNIGKPGFLNADQILEMERGGISFGSHTSGHAYLPEKTLESVQQELTVSKAKLESLLGKPVEFLSYPGGGYCLRIAQLAREAGYRAACTTNRGYRRRPVDLFALRRITAHSWERSRLGFHLRLSGFYDWTRRLRNPR